MCVCKKCVCVCIYTHIQNTILHYLILSILHHDVTYCIILTCGNPQAPSHFSCASAESKPNKLQAQSPKPRETSMHFLGS